MGSILNKLREAIHYREVKEYDKLFIIVDIHGTILNPVWNNEETYSYYPWAKEALRLLSSKSWVVLIMWSASYVDNLEKYKWKFFSDGIYFKYINENPEVENGQLCCFDKKIYCDVGIDDKFGFSPLTEWKEIYDFLIENKEY